MGSNSCCVWITLVIFQALLITSGISVISPEDQSVYHVQEGADFLVHCDVTSKPGHHVYWLRNDGDFYVDGPNLIFHQVWRNYSGVYFCNEVNATENYNGYDPVIDVNICNVKVDVQYPAEIRTFDISPSSVRLQTHFNVTLDVDGNPAPSWSVSEPSGLVLTSGIGTQVMSACVQAEFSHRGRWTAVANNSLNVGNAKSFANLTVISAPVPKSSINYVDETVIGHIASLVMETDAFPRPNYTWSRDDGLPIQAEQSDDAMMTRLDFSNVALSDFGGYSLFMENDYGNYTAHYRLVANGPPETPQDLYVDHVTCEAATLSWTSGYDMGSQQRFYVMHEIGGGAFIQMSNPINDTSSSHGVNATFTYELLALYSDTLYNISVVAINEKGFNSKLATPVAFKTKDRQKHEEERGALKGNYEILLGLLGAILVLCFAVWWFRRRRERRCNSQDESVQILHAIPICHGYSNAALDTKKAYARL